MPQGLRCSLQSLLNGVIKIEPSIVKQDQLLHGACYHITRSPNLNHFIWCHIFKSGKFQGNQISILQILVQCQPTTYLLFYHPLVHLSLDYRCHVHKRTSNRFRRRYQRPSDRLQLNIYPTQKCSINVWSKSIWWSLLIGTVFFNESKVSCTIVISVSLICLHIFPSSIIYLLTCIFLYAIREIEPGIR